MTTSNAITSFENATDGLVQIESVKGKTLQNLCSLDIAGASTGIPPNDAFSRLNKTPNLASGKTITLINNNDKKVRYSFSVNGAESSLHDVDAYKSKKVTLKDNEIMRFMVFFKRDGWTEINVKVTTGFMLEGDYTSNPPSYFEGIKSTGEVEGNKIEVVSVAKNLFDKSTITKGVIFIATSGGTSSKPDGYISDYINVVPNSKYIIKNGIGSSTYGHCFYNGSKEFISGIVSSAGYDTPQVITTPNNCAYIRTSGLLVKLDTQQLEKSDILTSYEDFKSDKVEIKLGSPLCGLPNGVADEIITDRVCRRIKKDILDSGKAWNITGNTKQNTMLFVTRLTDIFPKNNNPNVMSNNFIGDYVWSADREGIFSNGAGIYISILKSKLATPDVVGFKKWLTENNTEVYYELAEPTVSSINPTSLKSFQNGSIILNNVITPIIDLKYPTSIGGRLASVESTLDDTVDRTKKLEEGLLTTVTQVIDNKNKIEQSDLDIDALEETLKPNVSTTPFPYSLNVTGGSVIYKQYNCVNIPFQAQLKSLPTSALTKVGQLEYRHFPPSEINIMAIDGDATEKLGAVKILADGSVYVAKYGTGITDFKCNIFYITNN